MSRMSISTRCPFRPGRDPRRARYRRIPDGREVLGEPFRSGYDPRRNDTGPRPAVLRDAMRGLFDGMARERSLRLRRERYAVEPWYWNPATEAEYAASAYARRE